MEDKCRATDKYYAYIEANMLKGARIDAIGMQYHLFNKSEHEYEKTRLKLNPENLLPSCACDEGIVEYCGGSLYICT